MIVLLRPESLDDAFDDYYVEIARNAPSSMHVLSIQNTMGLRRLSEVVDIMGTERTFGSKAALIEGLGETVEHVEKDMQRR